MMLQKLHQEKMTVTHITSVDVVLRGTTGVSKKHTNTIFLLYYCVHFVFLEAVLYTCIICTKHLSLCSYEDIHINLGWHEGE